MAHLIRRHGCRRIGDISGPAGNQEADARLQGYLEALEAHGIAPDGGLVRHARFTLQTGKLAMRELLDSGCELDGLVAANDYMALGAMDVLRAPGVLVPRCGLR